MENIEQNRFTLHTPCFTPGVTHPLFDQVRSEKKEGSSACRVGNGISFPERAL